MSFRSQVFKYHCFNKKGRRRFYRFVCLKPGGNRYTVPVRVYSAFNDAVLVKVNFRVFFSSISSTPGGSGMVISSDLRTKAFCLTYLTGLSYYTASILNATSSSLRLVF